MAIYNASNYLKKKIDAMNEDELAEYNNEQREKFIKELGDFLIKNFNKKPYINKAEWESYLAVFYYDRITNNDSIFIKDLKEFLKKFEEKYKNYLGDGIDTYWFDKVGDDNSLALKLDVSINYIEKLLEQFRNKRRGK